MRIHLFRPSGGSFIFLAVLSFQYISSFSDLSSINKNESEAQNKIYNTLLDSVKNSNDKQEMKKVWEQQASNSKEFTDSLVFEIHHYQDSIKKISKKDPNYGSQRNELE